MPAGSADLTKVFGLWESELREEIPKFDVIADFNNIPYLSRCILQ